MLIPLTELLDILEKFRYFIIFPIAVIEGPIIIIISGFLVYLGILNGFLAFVLLTVADLIGDSIYYSVGRYGRNVPIFRKIGYFLGYDREIKALLHNHFEKHSIKTLLLAKVSHGVGSVVQVVAGITKLDYKKYLFIETIGTIPKTILLLVTGFYIGGSYVKINDYLNSFSLIIIIIFITIIVFILLNKYIRNFLNKNP